MKCRKCGSENMSTRPNPKNPAATDLFCADCGAWQKFANKDDVRKYGVQVATYSPDPDEVLGSFEKSLIINSVNKMLYATTINGVYEAYIECLTHIGNLREFCEKNVS